MQPRKRSNCQKELIFHYVQHANSVVPIIENVLERHTNLFTRDSACYSLTADIRLARSSCSRNLIYIDISEKLMGVRTPQHNILKSSG